MDTPEYNKVWLKAETFDGERRALLTPSDAQRLISKGIPVYVEKSATRIFPDTAYAAVGCTLAEPNTWNSEEAKNSVVLAVKYLDKVDRLDPAFPIKDRIIIHWAHSFDFDPEEQTEIARLEETKILVPALHGKKYKPKDVTLPEDTKWYNHQLNSIHAFHKTNLLDLEVMHNPDGSRMFDGYNAGLSGAAVSLFVWLNKYESLPKDDIPRPFDTKEDLVNVLAARFSKVPQSKLPDCAVIGIGRAGQGAMWLLEQLGLSHRGFTRKETANAQAFSDSIRDYDIAINCTCLRNNSKPLITDETLLGNKKLSVIGDVSSYPDLGVLQFANYKKMQTWDCPTLCIQEGEQPVDLVSIDNLPNLIAKPVSTMLSQKLSGRLIDFFDQQRDQPISSTIFGVPEAIAQRYLDLAASIKDIAFDISIHCFSKVKFNKNSADMMIENWFRENRLNSLEQKLFKGYFRTGFAQVYDIRNSSYEHAEGSEGDSRTQLAILDKFTDQLDVGKLCTQAELLSRP